jgi:hypothetical protein
MKVQRLQIEQQFARIEVHSQRAQVKIQTHVRRMQVDSERPQMSVDNQLGEVELDQTELKANTARRNIFDEQAYFAQLARQDARDGVSQAVADGDYMAQEPNPGNLRGSLELEKMLTVQTPVYGTDNASSTPSGVKMNGQGGKCQISWTRGKTEIQWEPYLGPEVTIDPEASVRTELVQPAEIHCEVVEESIPPETGALVDIDV